MDKCRQACPYNTLDWCKVKEYRGVCPLTNIATSITEYRMTNADRIRAMSDEEMAKKLQYASGCPVNANCIKMSGDCKACWLDWLQQPAEGE